MVAVICSSLLAIGTTVVLLLASKPDSGVHGPYSSLRLMAFPVRTVITPNPTEITNGNVAFCPDPQLRVGTASCVQLSDSTLSDALPGGTWPAPTPSVGCKIPAGWVLKVNFVDGTHLVYGPCEHPATIVQLRDWLLERLTP